MSVFGEKVSQAKRKASIKTLKKEQQGGLHGPNGDTPYLAKLHELPLALLASALEHALKESSFEAGEGCTLVLISKMNSHFSYELIFLLGILKVCIYQYMPLLLLSAIFVIKYNNLVYKIFCFII